MTGRPPAPPRSVTATVGWCWPSWSPCRSANGRSLCRSCSRCVSRVVAANRTWPGTCSTGSPKPFPAGSFTWWGTPPTAPVSSPASAPARTGKRGRPRLRGERIGTPADIAAQATEHGRWVDTRVRRYGRTLIARTTEITGLWYGVWRTDPVRVIVVNDSRRKPGAAGYDIAIVTTDLTASAADIIARYAARWSIEVSFHDAKN